MSGLWREHQRFECGDVYKRQLKELLSSGEVNQRELASLLGKSVSWVSKRLSLVQRLSEGVVHLVSARQLCPQTAQEIARLPSEAVSYTHLDVYKRQDIKYIVKRYDYQP